MDFNIPLKASAGGGNNGSIFDIDKFLIGTSHPDPNGIFLCGFDYDIKGMNTAGMNTSRSSPPLFDINQWPIKETISGKQINVYSQKMPRLDLLNVSSGSFGPNNIAYMNLDPGTKQPGGSTQYYFRQKMSYSHPGKLKGGIGKYSKLNFDFGVVYKAGKTGYGGGGSHTVMPSIVKFETFRVNDSLGSAIPLNGKTLLDTTYNAEYTVTRGYGHAADAHFFPPFSIRDFALANNAIEEGDKFVLVFDIVWKYSGGEVSFPLSFDFGVFLSRAYSSSDSVLEKWKPCILSLS